MKIELAILTIIAWSPLAALRAAETRMAIVGGSAAAAVKPGPGAPTAPIPATRANAGTRNILVTVVDGAGKKPIQEFRVIAGVKSGTGGTQEIVNWQPHTLRQGRNGALPWPMARAYDPMALRVEADGYAPKASAWMEKSKAQDVHFQLTADSGTASRVLTPEGKAAAGAMVALAMVQREAVLEKGWLRHAGEAPPEQEADRWRWPRIVMSDADGRFRLPPENDPTAAVLIVHERGVREMALDDFKKLREVSLQPWGRIEGRAQWGDVTGSHRKISLSIHRDRYGYPGVIAQYENATTDAGGHFIFERVLPGLAQVSCPMPATPGNKSGITEVNLPGMLTHVTVQPGRNPTQLGGEGRTVRGRLTGRDSWADVTFYFHPTAPHFGREGDGAMWAAWSALEADPVGRTLFRKGLSVNADGTFEMHGVLPGNYQIFFTRAGGKQHLATGKFTVPAETIGVKPDPHNIGDLSCRPLP